MCTPSFGVPCLAVCLADGAAPRLPAGASWLALSPDALTAARLAAGQVVLPQSLWRLCGRRLGLGPGLSCTADAHAYAAVGESAAEAAADAAERALRAGLASGGVGFSQLGGVGEHLRALRELVALPLRAPHLFSHYGIRPPRGVLLYGPPGSGKTVLARAAAADAGATVFVVNGPDVVSEYYGESEASLRGIFAAAAALSPSVVFIDEVALRHFESALRTVQPSVPPSARLMGMYAGMQRTALA
ncbi:Spermatogenesis-associated protein 5 [Tetrabaena socialis]|uniref:Spermatogenesis-associated protein 5 n=1 Tax=Tetrabaena socialis TaxID=47790 RepID=A0A2J8AJE4_9CHLO|nr:Spermatogenesis-associated protein 5 [Tetrabaena socialis]|eukprot:PNH12642.1 Spermatogenesis-associated protein 5 [Tetrabaena socialis]